MKCVSSVDTTDWSSRAEAGSFVLVFLCPIFALGHCLEENFLQLLLILKKGKKVSQNSGV